MTKTTTVEEFQISEVGTEAEADIICSICGYRGRIHLALQHTYYRNPNYDIILKKNSCRLAFAKFAELSVSAIMAVLDTIPVMLCTRCNGDKVKIAPESRYNPNSIWDSLECHKSF